MYKSYIQSYIHNHTYIHAGFERLCHETRPVSWEASEPRSDWENIRELSVQEHEEEQDVQLFSSSRRVHESKEIWVSQER